MRGTRGEPMRPSARPVVQALLIASRRRFHLGIVALGQWSGRTLGRRRPVLQWCAVYSRRAGRRHRAATTLGTVPGVVVGQVLYLLLPLSPLLAVGFAFLLLWSLLFLAGAYAGARLRSR